MSTLPQNGEKFIPTEDEIAAMRAIDSAVALGQLAAKIPNVSKRLYDHGVVENNQEGLLVLTVKGKRLLRASNTQG
jgi:hypothetical protein